MACSWVISHKIPSYLFQGETSTSLNNNLMAIGYRTIIWPGLANILDVIYAIGMGIGLSIHLFGCSPVYLSTHHTFIMSTHFQTNSPGDLSETCWIHSSWYTADLVDFWSCSAAFQPFSGLRFVDMRSICCICCGDPHNLPCEDFKDGHHQLRLVAPGLSRE